MKSIHTFDVFAPTDEQEEAMNKKRGGHYRRGKNKEMDYFIECATSLFPNNHYSRFTPIYDTTKEFYQLITSSDTTERAILNWIASNRAWNYLFGLLRHYYRYLFQTVAHTRELPFVRTGSASRGMGNGRRIVTPPARSLYHHLFKGIVGKQGHASSSSCSSSESPSPSSGSSSS